MANDAWPAVIILNANVRRPTFHRFGGVKPPQGDPSKMVTGCGRTWATFDSKRNPSMAFVDTNTAWLRADHARALGKPCGKCYPATERES